MPDMQKVGREDLGAITRNLDERISVNIFKKSNKEMSEL